MKPNLNKLFATIIVSAAAGVIAWLYITKK